MAYVIEAMPPIIIGIIKYLIKILLKINNQKNPFTLTYPPPPRLVLLCVHIIQLNYVDTQKGMPEAYPAPIRGGGAGRAGGADYAAPARQPFLIGQTLISYLIYKAKTSKLAFIANIAKLKGK